MPCKCAPLTRITFFNCNFTIKYIMTFAIKPRLRAPFDAQMKEKWVILMGCDLASHRKLITKFNGIEVTKHHYRTFTNGVQTPSISMRLIIVIPSIYLRKLKRRLSAAISELCKLLLVVFKWHIHSSKFVVTVKMTEQNRTNYQKPKQFVSCSNLELPSKQR